MKYLGYKIESYERQHSSGGYDWEREITYFNTYYIISKNNKILKFESIDLNEIKKYIRKLKKEIKK